MIRLIVSIASWLDKRFPERVEVKKSDFDALLARLDGLDAKINVSVHKDAVRDLLLVVQAQKDEMASLKASLGFNRPVEALNPDDVLAMLNGEKIHG